MEKMEIDDYQDKVTIKVKLPGEEYNDLVIDWSDKSGPLKGQQVIDQLSIITGIPLDYIRIATFVYTLADSVFMINARQSGSRNEAWNNKLTKENCAGKMNDGDCFAIETHMDYLQDEFKFSLFLYSRDLFNDHGCTFDYCHYVNNRAFLNRQIGIATNNELIMKLRSKLKEVPNIGRGATFEAYVDNHIQRMKVFQDLNIRHFIFNSLNSLCRLRNAGPACSTDLLHYSRTHG